MQTNQMKKYSLNEDVINYYMKLAIEQSKIATDKLEVAVGCVMVKFTNNNQDHEIVAQSHNKTNQYGNATLHCEINCINEILDKYGQNYDEQQIFKQITLFVTCEPCIMCAYSLSLMGIKEVYFGCYNEKFGGNGTILDLNTANYGANTYPSYGGFLEEECKQVLKQFYEKGNLNLDEDKRHRRKKKEDKDESVSS
ncbi:cytidine and deoxycytidylate deaminase zinc-binding region protein (macronuclear) [Tetrahymena thermophila SB210]|uniref:Cytidine and deoxycytidylate deaminase zinc-binding region protein n=1 Tax=Tetrahymena thermophila (strain SB210) TaxID=312017 RepID=I7M9H8_TETTS|nr:cytidine and deoxycytidylate deaminase zinc-binding region protein [Tetrahymena thermophila SB210]EAS01780.2 cytidine and deoxycytidylate deaminase zinc-binding region protein [Tetrahymena thermophila SB210]|eukprot:XP_001022025.2 cytidine and deoxycytidylate deaminase zinc-binding region protein [Tetrahymena thermophila SB210]